MKPLFTFLLLLFLANKINGQTFIYVDSSIAIPGSGTSWSAAYKTLNDALQIVNANTSTKYIIRVARGTYYPTGIQSATDRDSSFLILRGALTIEGGYPSGGGVRNTALQKTVLSGNIGQASDSTDNSYHVIMIPNVTTLDTIVLSGLTVAYGHAVDTSLDIQSLTVIQYLRSIGGGVCANRVTLSLNISDCIFRRNVSSFSGGGIWLKSIPQPSSSSTNGLAKLNIRNTLFSQNASAKGGGLCVESEGIYDTIVNCTFTENSGLTIKLPSSAGAGCCLIHMSTPANAWSNCFLDSCNFTNNKSINASGLSLSTYSINSSGAMYSSVTNCGFSGNQAVTGAGGMLYVGTAGNTNPNSGVIRGCSFVNNMAQTGSGGGLGIGLVTYPNTSGVPTFDLGQSHFSGNYAVNGAGLHINCDSGNIAIHAILDSGNIATGNGGGICAIGSAGNSGGNLSLDSVRILDNMAGFDGGGIYYIYDRGTISNSILAGNTALNGGGICIYNSSTIINNDLICGNRATSRGGAVCNISSAPVLRNCTVSGDSAQLGNGVYNEGPLSKPILLNSIIWEGIRPILDSINALTTVTYSALSAPNYPGAGNVNGNPLFVSPLPPSAAPTSGGDYRLLLCSPAIDAGQNVGSYLSLKDLDGKPRLYGAKVDMGAYEIHSTYPASIFGRDSLCQGSTMLLSTAATGGNWISTNSSIATVTNSGLVTGVFAGTDTIVYNNLGTPCPSLANKIVTVLPAPIVTAITGSSPLCVGSATLFSNITAGGVWRSSDTTVAVVNSGLVTTVKAGVDTISYTTTNGFGCSSNVIKDLIVLPVADTNYSDTICQGTPYPFAGILLTSSGLYTHLFTGACGCDSAVTIQLTVKPLNVSVTQSGNTLLSAETNAGYQWIACGDNMPLVGDTSSTFTATSNGSYAVIVTKNGCTDTSACFNLSGLSIEGDRKKARIRFFPNPATSTLWLTTEQSGLYEVTISDAAGRLLKHYWHAGVTHSFDISDLGAGIYLLKVDLQGEDEQLYVERIAVTQER